MAGPNIASRARLRYRRGEACIHIMANQHLTPDSPLRPTVPSPGPWPRPGLWCSGRKCRAWGLAEKVVGKVQRSERLGS